MVKSIESLAESEVLLINRATFPMHFCLYLIFWFLISIEEWFYDFCVDIGVSFFDASLRKGYFAIDKSFHGPKLIYLWVDFKDELAIIFFRIGLFCFFAHNLIKLQGAGYFFIFVIFAVSHLKHLQELEIDGLSL